MPAHLFYPSFLNGGGFTRKHVAIERLGKTSCLKSPASGKESPRGLPWGSLLWAAWCQGNKQVQACHYPTWDSGQNRITRSLYAILNLFSSASIYRAQGILHQRREHVITTYLWNLNGSIIFIPVALWERKKYETPWNDITPRNYYNACALLLIPPY